MLRVFLSSAASVRVPHQRRAVLAALRRQAAVLLVALPLGDLLGLRLVVVRPEALALAGGHHADFVSPSAAARTLQLDPLRPGVSRDAAVLRGVAPPPLASGDGVGHEARGQALARAQQLLDGLGAAAGSVRDVTGGVQLPAAQLRRTWVGEQDIVVTTSWPRLKTNTLELNPTFCRLTASVPRSSMS